MRRWSLTNYFVSKTQSILRFYYFSLGQAIKNSSGQMRQPYAYDAYESTRRLVEGGISTGLTNTHTARGFSVLYHVFARKQCILCSELRHKSHLTLPTPPYVISIQDLFCLGTFARGFIRLLPRSLASSRGCSLATPWGHDLYREDKTYKLKKSIELWRRREGREVSTNWLLVQDKASLPSSTLIYTIVGSKNH